MAILLCTRVRSKVCPSIGGDEALEKIAIRFCRE